MSTIGERVYYQLGGHRFKAMTGARTFVMHSNALSFRVNGRHQGKRINHVKITLNEFDTYDLEASWVTMKKGVQVVCRASGVYVDKLRSAFEQATELRTSL